MKTIMSELKKYTGGINSTLDNAEEKICKLEGIKSKLPKIKHREKKIQKIQRTSMIRGTTSGSFK